MIFICKFIATPLLIGLSLLAARKWGPVIGAAIAGLPFISGPGSVFLCLENGAAFAGGAAHASIFGLMASCLYCITYARLARFCRWFIALPLSLLAFFILAFVFKVTGAQSPLWFVVALACPLACTKLIPQLPRSGQLPPSPFWKIPLQMICGGVAVLVITGVSSLLGEFWSGALLTFPIISSVIIPFAHQGYGFHVAVDTVRGLLYGLMGTAVFNVFLALSLGRVNPVLCYAVAFAMSMVCGVFFALKGRHDKMASAA